MIISNIYALIRGGVKCLFKKVTCCSLSYHPFIRIHRDVKLVVGGKSKITLGKGVLIGANTVCSATDGGHLEIGAMVGINNNSMIMCHESIVIDDNTIMGPGVLIYDHDHVFDSTNGVRRTEYVTSPVKIGKNCWVGAHVVILRGTTIGDNCLIGAGCIIKGTYADGSVIVQKREENIRRK